MCGISCSSLRDLPSPRRFEVDSPPPERTSPCTAERYLTANNLAVEFSRIEVEAPVVSDDPAEIFRTSYHFVVFKSVGPAHD